MRKLLLVVVLSWVNLAAPASAQGVYQGCPINVSPYVRCGNTIVSTSTATTYVAPNYGYTAPAYGYTAPAYGYAAPAYGYAAPAYGYAAPAYGYAAPAYFSYGTSNYSYQPYVIPQQTPQYVQPTIVVTSNPFGASTFSSAPVRRSGYSTFSSAPVQGFGSSTFSSAPVVRFGSGSTLQTFSGAPSFGTYNAAVYGAPTGVHVRGRRR